MRIQLIARLLFRFTVPLIVMAGLALPASSASHDVIARVIAIQGEATVAATGDTLRRGSALREGDLVTTGEDARVRVRFVGGSLLTLGADTRLEVTQYEPAREGQSQQAYFRLLDGVILAVAEGVSQGEGDYTIETTAGSIGIRGTIVWGGYFIPDQADFVLFEGGPVEISNEFGSVLLTEPGQGTTVPVVGENEASAGPLPPEFWTPSKAFEATTTITF